MFVAALCLAPRWASAGAERVGEMATSDTRDMTRARTLYVGLQVLGAVARPCSSSCSCVGLASHTASHLAAVPPVTDATFVGNRLWTFQER